MASQMLQQLFNVGEGPALSFSAIVQAIVGHTLPEASILLLCQDNWCTPGAIVLNDLTCFQLFPDVFLDGLQLSRCKPSCTWAIERGNSRFQIDFMLYNIGETHLCQVVREAVLKFPQEVLDLLALVYVKVWVDVNLFKLVRSQKVVLCKIAQAG